MSAPLVFMDTETTGLSLTDDIWEFAAIRREPDGTETTAHIFIEHDRDKCRELPLSFRDDHYARFRDHHAYTRRDACQVITDVFRNGKPHVVGAVPNFDTERLAQFVSKQWPHWPPLGWHDPRPIEQHDATCDQHGVVSAGWPTQAAAQNAADLHAATAAYGSGGRVSGR